MKNKLSDRLVSIQPYLLILFLTLFLCGVIISTYLYADKFLPAPVSVLGKQVSPLFTTTLIITGIAFFITHILLFYFAFRYRKSKSSKVFFQRNNKKLELWWMIVPAITFLFLFVWGQLLWTKLTEKAPDDALMLDVMGAQFFWWVRYPGNDDVLGESQFQLISQDNPMGIDFNDPHSKDDFVPVQMHVQKDKPVQLLLRSRDVIHSFFIPHLRVKMDAVPGMTTRVHFTPTRTTAEMRSLLHDPDFNYEIACAELCGRMHFAMKLILVVDDPDEYEAWSSRQQHIQLASTSK